MVVLWWSQRDAAMTSQGAAPTRPAHGNQLRAERTRAALIEVTVEIVVSEGIAAATGRHIADTAGVTWGVIQYHFGDRDGLLLAVVDQGFGNLQEALESLPAATPDTSTRQLVEAVVEAVWQAIASSTARAAIEILIGTRATRGASITERIKQLGKTFSTLGATIDRDLGLTGNAAVGDLLLTSLRGMIANQLVMHRPVDTIRERRHLVDILISYIDQHHEANRRQSRSTS